MAGANDLDTLITRLQVHVPFLKDMIVNLKKGMPQHSKIVALHNMITDKKRKFKYDTLKKCEEVILKMKAKTNYRTKSQKDDDSYSIDSPDPEITDSFAKAAAGDKYVQEKPSVYSSVAESIEQPHKAAIEGLVAIVPEPDTSKPPISVSDLELLKSDDVVEPSVGTSAVEKVVKKESKISLVPAPIIKPKHKHDKTEKKEKESPKGDKKSKGSTPEKIDKINTKGDKSVKDSSDSIFGDLLSGIDEKIIVKKRRDSKEGGDKCKEGKEGGLDKQRDSKEGSDKHKENKQYKDSKESDKPKGSKISKEVDNTKESKISKEVDKRKQLTPKEETKTDNKSSEGKQPEKVYKRLADKYNPKPKKPDTNLDCSIKPEDLIIPVKPIQTPSEIIIPIKLIQKPKELIIPKKPEEMKIPCILSPERNPFDNIPKVDPRLQSKNNTFMKKPTQNGFSPTWESSAHYLNQSPNCPIPPSPIYNNPIANPPPEKQNIFPVNQPYLNRPNNPNVRPPNINFHPNNNFQRMPHPLLNSRGPPHMHNQIPNFGHANFNQFMQPQSRPIDPRINQGPPRQFTPFEPLNSENELQNEYFSPASESPNPYSGPNNYLPYNNRCHQNFQRNQYNHYNREMDIPCTYKSWREERGSRDPRISRREEFQRGRSRDRSYKNSDYKWSNSKDEEPKDNRSSQVIGPELPRSNSRVESETSLPRDTRGKFNSREEVSNKPISKEEPIKPITADEQSKSESGKSISKTESGKSNSKTESGKSISKIESGKSISKTESGKSISKTESGKSNSKTESGKSISKIESGKSVSKTESGKSVSRTEDSKSGSGTESGKLSSGKESAKSGSGTESGKSGSGTESAKSSSRPASPKLGSETESGKVGSGTESCKPASRTVGGKSVSGKQVGKSVSGTQVSKSVSGAEGGKSVSGADGVKSISGTDGGKSVSGRDCGKSVSGTESVPKERGRPTSREKSNNSSDSKVRSTSRDLNHKSREQTKSISRSTQENSADKSTKDNSKSDNNKKSRSPDRKKNKTKYDEIYSSFGAEVEENLHSPLNKTTSKKEITKVSLQSFKIPKKAKVVETVTTNKKQENKNKTESEIQVSSSEDTSVVSSNQVSSTEVEEAKVAAEISKNMETCEDALKIITKTQSEQLAELKSGLPADVKEEFRKWLTNIKEHVGTPIPLLDMFGMIVDYMKPTTDSTDKSKVDDPETPSSSAEVDSSVNKTEAEESEEEQESSDQSSSSKPKRKKVKKVKKAPKKSDLKKKEELDESDEDDNLVESVGERIKNRKRIQPALPQIKKQRKNELDKLHDDIKETMGEGVLAVSSKRSCTIQKDVEEEKVKIGGGVIDKVKNVKVVLQKLPDLRKTKRKIERELSTSPLPKRKSMTRAAKAIASYADEEDEDLYKKSDLEKDEVNESAKTTEEKAKTTEDIHTDEVMEKENDDIPKIGRKRRKSSVGVTDVIKKRKISDRASRDDLFYVEPDKNYYQEKDRKIEYKCKVCDFVGFAIVEHYMLQHPKMDCLISRLSPEDTMQALKEAEIDNLETADISDTKTKHYFKCRFCLQEFDEVQSLHFYNHLTSHTCEFRFKCTSCHFKTNGRKDLKLHYSEVHEIEATSTQLIADFSPASVKVVCGYVCSECNFLQLNKVTVDEHIQIYHLDDTACVKKINLSLNYVKKSKASPKSKKKIVIGNAPVESKLDEITEQTIESSKTPVNSQIPRESKKVKSSEKENVVDDSIEKSDNENNVRELDISVFMCDTDIEDEASVKVLRLEKMKEINESVSPRRTSIINKLKDRFDMVTKSDNPLDTPTAGSQDNHAIVSNKEMIARTPDQETFVESKLMNPINSVVNNKSNISLDLNSIQENEGIFNNKSVSDKIEVVASSEKSKTAKSPEAAIDGELGKDVKTQVGDVLKTNTEQNVQVEQIHVESNGSLVDMELEEEELIDILSCPTPVKYPFTASTTNKPNESVNKVKKSLLPKLSKVVVPLHPDSENIMKIFTSPVIHVIISKNKEEEYKCRKPSCIFTTDIRRVFENHCSLTHKNERSVLACCSCNDKGTMGMVEIFKHLCQHVDKEIFELQVPEIIEYESIVISDDESPQFTFKISQVTSLAPKKSPSLEKYLIQPNPLPDNGLGQIQIAEVISLNKSPVFETMKSLSPAIPNEPNILTCRVTALSESEISFKRKSAAVTNTWLMQGVWGRLFKCPLYTCSFTTTTEDSFSLHISTHKFGSLVSCLYCNFKMKIEYYAIHLVVRHKNCKHGCPHCLYRAVNEDYVKCHIEEEHKDSENKVLHFKDEISFTRYRCPGLKPMKDYMKPYLCKCSKKYYAKENMTKHLKTCPENKNRFIFWNIFEYNCRYCNFSEPTTSNFLKHMSKHHPFHPVCIITRHLKDPIAVQDDEDDTIFDKLQKITMLSGDGSESDVIEVASTTKTEIIEKKSPSPPVAVPSTKDDFEESTEMSAEDDDAQIKTKGLSGRDLFKCAICKVAFPDSTIFKSHLFLCMNKEGENKKPVCFHCDKTFKGPLNLIEHIRIHGTVRISCSLCSYKNTHQWHLRAHMKLKHKVVHCKFVPADPKKTNIDTDEFIVRPVIHRRSSAVESQPPRDQPTTPTSEPPLIYSFGPDNIHMLPIKSIFNYNVSCSICNFQTKVRMNLLRHMSQHEKGKETSIPVIAPVNPVPCLEKNELMFDKMTNLASSSHAGGRMGGKSVTEGKINFPVHVPLNKRYVCGAKNCNYLCLEESMLQHHLQALHTHESTYTCAHCSEDLVSENTNVNVDDILNHLRLHDATLYKCFFCNHVSNNRNKVEKHCSEKHSDKTVRVTVVREESERNVDAEVKEGKETREGKKKPWKCAICKGRFHSKDDVMLHARSKHAIDSQYKCSYCDFKTLVNDSFTDHFETTHNGMAVDYIVVYYNDGQEVGKPEDPKEAFDTTPLWVKNRINRVKNIRGILIEEQTKVKKSPIKLVSITAEKKLTASTGKKTPDTSERKSLSAREKKTTLAEKKKAVTTEKKTPVTNEKKIPVTPEKKGPVTTTKKGSATNEKKGPVTTEKIDLVTNDETVTVTTDKVNEETLSSKTSNLDLSIEAVASGTSTTQLEPVKKKLKTKALITNAQEGLDCNIKDPPLSELHNMPIEKLKSINFMGVYGPLGKPYKNKYLCPLCASYKTKEVNAFEIHLCKELQYYKYGCQFCSHNDVTLTGVQEHILQKHTHELPQHCNVDFFKCLPAKKAIENWMFKVRAAQDRLIKDFYDRQKNCRESSTETSDPEIIILSPSTKSPTIDNSKVDSSDEITEVDDVKSECSSKLLVEMKRVSADFDESKEGPLVSINKAVKPYVCSLCDHKLMRYGFMKKHIKTHPEHTAYIQDSAGNSMKTGTSICFYCSLESVHRKYLVKHHKCKHPSKELAIMRHEDPENIIKISPMIDRLKCGHCDSIYKDVVGLKAHYHANHSDEDFVFVEFGTSITSQVKIKETARKSTSSAPDQKSSSPSHYGMKPDITDEECKRITTTLEIMNNYVTMNVAQLSKLLNIFPRVEIVDCNKKEPES